MSLARRVSGAAFGLAESGRLDDRVIRLGVRALVRSRVRSLRRTPPLDPAELSSGPIAPAPAEANQQHYEVPPAFFELVLGRWRKYSSCLWRPDTADLDRAEEDMLDATMRRAALEDGHRVLDLGCGWGSFSLYAAERLPTARFLAVSNSGPQRDFIQREALRLGLENVEARTADVNDLELRADRFDRIVSIEMFEHMRNLDALMRRVASWLVPGGRLFVHVFCHCERAYRFETEGAGDWMGRRFFTGGLMPSVDTLPRFRGELELEELWRVDGTHYAKTAEAWLEHLDRGRERALAIFAEDARANGAGGGSPEASAGAEVDAWRLFFLAVAETFGFRGGSEWGVAHYRFARG